jgi:hypothetical protein
MAVAAKAAPGPELNSPATGELAESDAPVPKILIFILKPERCWPCWLAILLLGLVAVFLTGREVLRQRRIRLRALSPLNRSNPDSQVQAT